MHTSDLDSSELISFAPTIESGAKLQGQGVPHDVLIRHEGTEAWVPGVTSENLETAWACQNYIRRTYEGRVAVKIRKAAYAA